MSTLNESLTPKEEEHAKYAPSAWKRIYECPISVWLGHGLPERPETSYSKDGTLAHKVGLEICLKAKLEGKPFPKVFDPQFSKEMIKHAKGLANFIHSQIEPYLKYKHTWFIEQRVTLQQDVWGTADFIFLYRKEEKLYAILIDYKYGEGIEVEVEDNWQVIVYMLASMKEFSSEKVKLEQATAHIYQPRTTHNPEPIRYNAKVLTAHYLPKIKETVSLIEGWFKANEVSEEDFKAYQNYGSWCQFCKAKPVCKLYKQHTAGKTLKLFKQAALHVVDDVANEGRKNKGKPKKLEAKDMQNFVKKGVINVEEFAFIALNASKIKTFIDLFPPAAKALLSRGEKIPLKMIETQGERSLIADEKLLIKKLKNLGIENPIKTVTKFMTITEIEKEIGRNTLEQHNLTTRGPKNVKLVPYEYDGEGEIVEPKTKSKRLFKEALHKNKKTS